jgi:hypothetical protein
VTTLLQVRNAWNTKVWTQTSVQDITDKIYLHDVFVESESDFAKLVHAQKVNYFTCVVLREHEAMMMTQTRQRFQVTVTHYLQQADQEDSNFNPVLDHLALVDDLVISSLGSSWDSTIDFYNGSSLTKPEIVNVNGIRCWRAGYTYLGTKTI